MISGLVYTPNYVSSEDQGKILSEIDALTWSNELKRRVQHYGYKYDYTYKTINSDMVVGPMPSECQKLASRLCADGIFSLMPDQLIVNEYMPGQGIAPHVDCVPCFEDIIVSVSLGHAYEMEFTRGWSKQKLLLEVGSMLCLRDEARYKWKHGIASRKSDSGVVRQRRVSLTFRRVILS